MSHLMVSPRFVYSAYAFYLSLANVTGVLAYGWSFANDILPGPVRTFSCSRRHSYLGAASNYSPNAILYTYPASLAHGAMALLLGKCNIRQSSSLVGFHETLSAVYAPLPV